MRRSCHVNSMKVEAGTLIDQLVVDVDNDIVALGDDHWWRRPLIVDANDLAFVPEVRISSGPGDVPVEGYCGSICAERNGEEEKYEWGHEVWWRADPCSG